MEYRSPLAMLYHWERMTPGKVYLKQPINGIWHEWTWQQVAGEVRQLATSLQALEIPPNSHIAILSKNCAHWIICDLAIMMAGHVSIPLYPNLQAESVEQILERSESVVLFIGKLDQWESVKTVVSPEIKCIAFPFCNHDGCEPWSDFIAQHQPIQQEVDRRGVDSEQQHRPIPPDADKSGAEFSRQQKSQPQYVDRDAADLCSIIYTSGTVGAPKGAMFNFDAFAFAAQHAIERLGFSNSDRFFSYLPLSHVAERMLVEMVSLYTGGEVSFSESLQSFGQNLADARPTIFLGVHRIWSKFQQGILTKFPQKKLDILLRVPVLAYFIKKKIRERLGLNETRMALTGAAPTPPALIEWFRRIGIKIQEAYAMTENCCYSHVTLKENIKIGFVGQPLPLCEVRLGESNEIQMRHRALMLGYYKEPEKSMEVFTDDGFLKTGDEGFIDEEGFLKITGRIKDLFKTAKGKYVAPSPIEMKISANDIVEQVCVVGSGLAQPMAIVTLSETGRRKSAEEISALLKGTLQGTNESLDAHEKMKKIIIVKEPWLVENNLLTPSLKIKRNEIEKRYAARYEEWYDLSGSVNIQP
jgi:long-chain acyl-CoA synthetase